MLPEDATSSITVSGRFMQPDSSVVGDTSDYEWGGLAIGDTSAGHLAQIWECRYEGLRVRAYPSIGDAVDMFDKRDIDALSFTFDQQMNPVVAFEVKSELWLWWVDQSGLRRTDSFGVGRCPRVTLDDKRRARIAESDIIFAYIRDDLLCYRQQRDNYAVERVLRSGVKATTKLRNLAMSSTWRLQFELV